jgi:membrane associated rhomboid family serine protease
MTRRNTHTLSDAVQTSGLLVLGLYAIFLLDVALGWHLARFGIQPRRLPGLVGIVFSPLLHANLAHLVANTIPLFVLLVLLFSDRFYDPFRTLALIWLVSGLGTWLIGRSHSVHIGASSVIFGLVVYLITAGIRMQSWRAAIVAVAVFVVFGGMLLGVLPRTGPISWEGHLCGALTGFWAAKNQA